MSKEEKEESKEASGGKGNKKLLMIIAVLVLLLVLVIGGAAGAFMTMNKAPAAAPQAKDAEGEHQEEGAAHEGEGEEEAAEGGHGEKEGGPAVMPLEPFIVNLQVKGSYLKATMQLKFSGKGIPKNAESELPKIRDAVIRTLSSKSAAEILTAEGKEALREEVKKAINTAFGSDKVVQIYFTEFIIQ